MAKPTHAAAATSVHLTLQGKGGVGKSLAACLLAQYFNSAGEQVRCIDTDPVNQTLMGYKALGAQHIRLMNGSKIDERNFDSLMERLLSEEGTFVVDNGASSFVPLSNYLVENQAISMLEDAGRKVTIHCVVTGGQALDDTLIGFKALAQQQEITSIVVWLNEFFGAVEGNGKVFNEMKVYLENQAKVRGIMRIAKRNADTFGRDIDEMTARKLTFAEVMSGAEFSIMSKQRIKTVQKDIFEQLAALGL